MVPKNLLAEQKHERMAPAQDCLEQVESDPTLLNRVITGDESMMPKRNDKANSGCLLVQPDQRRRK